MSCDSNNMEPTKKEIQKELSNTLEILKGLEESMKTANHVDTLALIEQQRIINGYKNGLAFSLGMDISPNNFRNQMENGFD